MRIAIISDIHEDILRLKTALSQINSLNCDEVVCLGDISGFSVTHYKHHDTRNAHECLNIIRTVCNMVVPGNHDMHAAKIIPNNSPYFNFPENWHQLDYHQKKNAFKKHDMAA